MDDEDNDVDMIAHDHVRSKSQPEDSVVMTTDDDDELDEFKSNSIEIPRILAIQRFERIRHSIKYTSMLNHIVQLSFERCHQCNASSSKNVLVHSFDDFSVCSKCIIQQERCAACGDTTNSTQNRLGRYVQFHPYDFSKNLYCCNFCIHTRVALDIFGENFLQFHSLDRIRQSQKIAQAMSNQWIHRSTRSQSFDELIGYFNHKSTFTSATVQCQQICSSGLYLVHRNQRTSSYSKPTSFARASLKTFQCISKRCLFSILFACVEHEV